MPSASARSTSSAVRPRASAERAAAPRAVSQMSTCGSLAMLRRRLSDPPVAGSSGSRIAQQDGARGVQQETVLGTRAARGLWQRRTGQCSPTGCPGGRKQLRARRPGRPGRPGRPAPPWDRAAAPLGRQPDSRGAHTAQPRPRPWARLPFRQPAAGVRPDMRARDPLEPHPRPRLETRALRPGQPASRPQARPPQTRRQSGRSPQLRPPRHPPQPAARSAGAHRLAGGSVRDLPGPPRRRVVDTRTAAHAPRRPRQRRAYSAPTPVRIGQSQPR